MSAVGWKDGCRAESDQMILDWILDTMCSDVLCNVL